MSARRMFASCKPNPELDALIAKAKKHVMTSEEKAAQQKSWVIGEFMLSYPDVTREYAEKVYADVVGL